MSILVVGASGDAGGAVIGRLVEQGDEVRVIEADDGAADRWRELGAHVARGSAGDADLVERAAQNVRTVVVLGPTEAAPLIQGALSARVGRFVWCTDAHDEHEVESAGTDFVLLVVPRSRFRKRAAIPPDALAQAVDAADDLAGTPRIRADLGDASGWRELGLDPLAP